jgi:hypothetical protein
MNSLFYHFGEKERRQAGTISLGCVYLGFLGKQCAERKKGRERATLYFFSFLRLQMSKSCLWEDAL